MSQRRIPVTSGRNSAAAQNYWLLLALSAFAAFAAFAFAGGIAHADASAGPTGGGTKGQASHGRPAAAVQSRKQTRTPSPGNATAGPASALGGVGNPAQPNRTWHAGLSVVVGPPRMGHRPAGTPAENDAAPAIPAMGMAHSVRTATVPKSSPRADDRLVIVRAVPSLTPVRATTAPPSEPSISIGLLANWAVDTAGASASALVSVPTSVLSHVVGGQAGQWIEEIGALGVALTQAGAQLGRQAVGVVFDVGAMLTSGVSNVADVVAEAIGPNALLGVPYSVATTVGNVAADISKTLTGVSLKATSTGPFPVDYGVYDFLANLTPTSVPGGANDPSITVTPEHPLPVILLNGTLETQAFTWSVGAPVLANAGYKVYTFNYGNVTDNPNSPFQATNDIAKSAAELSDEVAMVLAETGAPQVILIGHSQGGGIMPEYYINNLGGAGKVSQLIGIAPSNHGTDLDYVVPIVGSVPILGSLLLSAADIFGQALGQQLVTSPFQQVVYGDGDTRPGVLYTTIASTNDEVVTPYTQEALDGPAVTNIVIQDEDPGFAGGHINPLVWADVLNALADNPQASPAMGEDPLVAA